MAPDDDYIPARVKKPVKLSGGAVSADNDRLRFGQLEWSTNEKYTKVPVWKYEIEFTEIKTIKLNGATLTFKGELRDGTDIEFRVRGFVYESEAKDLLAKMQGAAIEGGSSFKPISDDAD